MKSTTVSQSIHTLLNKTDTVLIWYIHVCRIAVPKYKIPFRTHQVQWSHVLDVADIYRSPRSHEHFSQTNEALFRCVVQRGTILLVALIQRHLRKHESQIIVMNVRLTVTKKALRGMVQAAEKGEKGCRHLKGAEGSSAHGVQWDHHLVLQKKLDDLGVSSPSRPMHGARVLVTERVRPG